MEKLINFLDNSKMNINNKYIKKNLPIIDGQIPQFSVDDVCKKNIDDFNQFNFEGQSSNIVFILYKSEGGNKKKINF
jgi:hypothetical protein